MLFLAKRRAATAWAAAAVLAMAAWLLKQPLGLAWNMSLDGDLPWKAVPWKLAVGILAVAASDGLLHTLFRGVGGRWYAERYRLLIDSFAGQTPLAMLAGAVLAGAEELLFRGVLLEALRSSPGGLGEFAAVVISGAAFGAAHALPDRRLALFAVWSVWEGVVLGALYVWTGSLAAAVILHALHDFVGFSAWAWQRRTGALIDPWPRRANRRVS